MILFDIIPHYSLSCYIYVSCSIAVCHNFLIHNLTICNHNENFKLVSVVAFSLNVNICTNKRITALTLSATNL